VPSFSTRFRPNWLVPTVLVAALFMAFMVLDPDVRVAPFNVMA
jgi:hypothetical protein